MAFGTQFYGNGALNPHDPKAALPKLSYALDSVRTHQFEVHIEFPNAIEGISQNGLTLAAKQVSEAGFAVGDIEVNRVNDKVFYPGRPEQDELTVTFDNLYLKETSDTLFQWFQNTYDPLTGEMTKTAAPGVPGGGSFKANKMTILQLAKNMDPHSAIECYGVWVKSWKTAEFNYATNEFHTIEVEFRYDFMNHISNSQLS